MIARRNFPALSGAGMATLRSGLTVACPAKLDYISSAPPACGILPAVTVHRETLGPGGLPRLGLESCSCWL
jgi:hypothetical protein